MSNPKPLIWLIVAAIGLALAAATSYSVIVNGQVADEKAIVVNGKTYIPLSTLKLLGISSSLKGTTLTLGGNSLTQPSANVTPGGANQRDSLEGCIGETLFNGIWRLKVTKLEAITRDPGTPVETPGWGVTVELRNGAKATLVPAADTGVKSSMIAFSDAQTITAEPLGEQKLTFANLPQGGVVVTQLHYYYPYDIDRSTIQKPVKFLFEIDPKGWEGAIKSRAGGSNYTTPTPSFRVKLDCQK